MKNRAIIFLLLILIFIPTLILYCASNSGAVTGTDVKKAVSSLSSKRKKAKLKLTYKRRLKSSEGRKRFDIL